MPAPRTTPARTVLVLTAVVAATLAALPAQAAESPQDPLNRAVAAVLAQAVPGEPLKVVTTTRTADGPRITTAVASTRTQARGLITSGLSRPSTIGVDLARPVQAAASNDTFRSQQWALTRFGAETVWKKSTGSGVVVAVIDTGVYADHPDLKGRVLPGYDFVTNKASGADFNGHGTHVAGIIAATADNKRGIAGLARSAKILPVRVLDAKGSGDTAGVARGIVWAVDHGAKVINLSLAGSGSDSAGKAAVAYAVSKNVVVVAAAGNNGCNALFGSPTTYPAAYDGVLGVAAITRTGATASYSNCGSYVDVAAPGSEVVSTMTAKPDPSLGCPAGTTYCVLSGTSMAAPHAAAAAALLIARTGKGYKQATVRSIIESTAKDTGAKGKDRNTGSGIIDPQKMLAGR